MFSLIIFSVKLAWQSFSILNLLHQTFLSSANETVHPLNMILSVFYRCAKPIMYSFLEEKKLSVALVVWGESGESSSAVQTVEASFTSFFNTVEMFVVQCRNLIVIQNTVDFFLIILVYIKLYNECTTFDKQDPCVYFQVCMFFCAFLTLLLVSEEMISIE